MTNLRRKQSPTLFLNFDKLSTFRFRETAPSLGEQVVQENILLVDTFAV